MAPLFEIRNLSVLVSGKLLLKKINLKVNEGEVHVLLGPNGCGKSSLLNTILGFPNYKVTSGSILFRGRDITKLPINERAKLGIGIVFQTPPEITGVKLEDMLKIITKRDIDSPLGKKEIQLTEKMNFPEEFLKRDVNVGFSGGERKRSEIMQLIMQAPMLSMIDEPDSGVDVENLRLIGGLLNNFLKSRSALIVTHLGAILDYFRADIAHVMVDGELGCSGDPKRILNTIIEKGYQECVQCIRDQRKGLPSREKKE